MNKSKISVVVPIYNVEKYLERCIDSIINQTYKNIEIILIDDGSPDSCPRICDYYASIDARVKVIHKINGGLSDARNAGIDIATGTYISFIDSDDYVSNDYIEYLHRAIANNNSSIATCKYEEFNESSLPFINDNDTKIVNYSPEQALQNMYYQKEFTHSSWGKLYDIDLFKNIRYPKGKICEDLGTTYRLIAISKKVTVCSSKKYYYYKRTGSIMNSTFSVNRMDGIEFAICQLEFTKNNYPKIKKAAIYRLFFEAIHIYLLPELHTNKFKLEMETILNIINKTKPSVSLDRNAPKNYRLYAISALINAKLIIFLNYFWRLMRSMFLSLKNLFYDISMRACSLFKNTISHLLPVRIKIRLIYLLSRSRNYDYLEKNRKKIIITLAADYGNLGDVAITAAQHAILLDNFKDYQIVELPISRTYRDLKSLKKKISPIDVITIVGGGNMGNLYESTELMRQFIIQKFSKNRIISFPQTIYFTNDKKGERDFKSLKRIYLKHKQLHLITRDSASYHKMLSFYPSEKTYLTPDIVLYLNEVRTETVRSKGLAVLCMRSDLESNLDNQERRKIESLLSSSFTEVLHNDTNLGDVNIPIDRRNTALEEIWNTFRKSELVITDRLHGMIFCAITNTPCIAINNNNGKVKGVYDLWINKLGHITLIESFNAEKISLAIRHLQQADDKRKIDFNRSDMFVVVKKILKEIINRE